MRPIVLKLLKYSKKGKPLEVSRHLCNDCPIKIIFLSEKINNFDKNFNVTSCKEYKDCVKFCFENKKYS